MSNFLEQYQITDGKKLWRFVASIVSCDSCLMTEPQSAYSSVALAAAEPDVVSELDGLPNLPGFAPVSDAAFMRGSMDSQSFCHALEAAYQEIVHWRSNCFSVPHGNCGEHFVLELASLFRTAGEGSSLESVAMKAAFTLCSLVLQKPSRNSKSKDHISCLEKRLKLWKDGDLSQ